MGNHIGQPERTGVNVTALFAAVGVTVLLGLPFFFLIVMALR